MSLYQKSNVWQKLKRQERKFKESGDKAMEKEYNQIYGIVMDLLDKMVEILGEETVNRQEFRQLLESGLSQAKVALIPPSIDQVMVGDMERSRLKEIKALFFVGVNEGNIQRAHRQAESYQSLTGISSRSREWNWHRGLKN